MSLYKQLRMQSHVNKKIQLSRSRAGSFGIFIFLLLICGFMVLPVVYAVVQSIKPIEEYYIFPPRFFVQNPTFQNYRDIFALSDNLWVPFSRYLFNTVFISVVGTVVYVIIASMAAYPLAKSKIPGVFIISQLIVWTLLFNSQSTAVVQYMVVSIFGMVDTYWAILLPMLAGTMGVFLMQQFIHATIHDSILEAARIDGANEFTILFRIVMPTVKTGWLTVIVFTFQSFWNNNSSNYIYSENLKQLSAVLGSISSGGIARAGAGAAVVILMMIPTVIVFLYTQRSIMETMAYSGLK
jgi:putative chitobiose transport system permease protein